MNKHNNTFLKILGILLVLVGITYAVVGSAALAGMHGGLAAGQEGQGAIVIVLSYTVAVLALASGVVCMLGKKTAAKAFGVIFIVLGVGFFIYSFVTARYLSILDLVAVVVGILIIVAASRKER